MNKTQTFRDLIVWQKGIDLVLLIYSLSKKFPKEEIYGLTSQMRRASVAIPSNISEGYIRRHPKEYAQFINIAFASGAELETQLEICQKLGYITEREYQKSSELISEIMKMLNKLSSVLRASY